MRLEEGQLTKQLLIYPFLFSTLPNGKIRRTRLDARIRSPHKANIGTPLSLSHRVLGRLTGMNLKPKKGKDPLRVLEVRIDLLHCSHSNRLA